MLKVEDMCDADVRASFEELFRITTGITASRRKVSEQLRILNEIKMPPAPKKGAAQECTTHLFGDNKVTVQFVDGITLFNGNEVCSILEYVNARDAIATHCDEDDVVKRDTIDALGRTQEANFITEFGLYDLILGSNMPEARKFKRWVTHEVLPAIRKNGFYETEEYTRTKQYRDDCKRAIEDMSMELTYLQGKMSLTIDGRLCSIMHHRMLEMQKQIAIIEYEALKEVEESRSRDHKLPQGKAFITDRVRFMKSRIKDALTHVDDLERAFDETPLEGDFAIHYKLDHIRKALEFAQYW